jgi:hypothetical protein
LIENWRQKLQKTRDFVKFNAIFVQKTSISTCFNLKLCAGRAPQAGLRGRRNRSRAAAAPSRAETNIKFRTIIYERNGAANPAPPFR